MENYQLNILNLIKKHCHKDLFENNSQTISLEVGGVPEHTALAKSLIIQGKNNKVIQINKRIDLSDRDDKELAYLNMDALSTNFDDNSFDLIFGAAVLEHINHLDIFCQEMYRVLKKGGYLVLHGGPLWNSHWGHHLWVKVGESEYRFNQNNNPLPNWSHLYFSKEEMRILLKEKNIPKDHIDKIIFWIYESDEINRLGYDEIIKIIQKSDFTIMEVMGMDGQELNNEVYQKTNIDTKFANIYLVLKKKV